MINTSKIVASASAGLSHALDLEQSTSSLKGYCINRETVTMSGFSAGGTFAHLMQIVHSATVKGVGIMNGAPYYSAYDDITDNFVSA